MRGTMLHVYCLYEDENERNSEFVVQQPDYETFFDIYAQGDLYKQGKHDKHYVQSQSDYKNMQNALIEGLESNV